MSRSRTIILVALTWLLSIGPTCAGLPDGPVLPPSSAYINGLTIHDWPVDASGVGAIGEILATGAFTPADVVVRSGLSTQASWSDAAGCLSPHPRMYSNAPLAEAATLLGVGYSIAHSGGGGSRLRYAADEWASAGANAGRARIGLEWAVSQGHPVMVHVDRYYLWDVSSAQEPYWASVGQAHESRFYIVRGYDETYVDLVDIGPKALLGDARDDLRATWDSFLIAWRSAAALKGIARTGPYFSLTRSDLPAASAPTTPEWAFAYLSLDAANAPDAIRAAAAAIRNGADLHRALASARLFADARALMVTYADSVGAAEIKALYETSSAAWLTLIGAADAQAAADTLDAIADTEAAGLARMREYAATAAPIAQLYPDDSVNLPYTFPLKLFRWAALPGVAKPAVELAMTGNFLDKTGTVAFTPPFLSSHFVMTDGGWRKALGKDGNDRRLSWRVSGTLSGEPVHSGERAVTWDPLKLVLTSPANGYMLGKYTAIELTWSGPTFIRSPRAAFSFDGDFTDPARLIYRQASRTSMSVYAPYTVYEAGRNRGYTTVYWRIEDPATGAFIEPSDANNMAIVQ